MLISIGASIKAASNAVIQFIKMPNKFTCVNEMKLFEYFPKDERSGFKKIRFANFFCFSTILCFFGVLNIFLL